MRRRTYNSFSLVAILLLAFALRAAPLAQNRLMEDEALYGAWGLQIASGADPMLDYEPVDKPPLFPYTLALAFKLFGLPPRAPAVQSEGGEVAAEAWLLAAHQMEVAARLPSLMASVASVALVYALGRRLGFRAGDERVGLLAALLVAVSPFDILFASTAFTDPLMVALVLGALLAAVVNRPAVAGLLAGFAWGTKQQAALFLPLALAAVLLWSRSAMPRADGSGTAATPGNRRHGAWYIAKGWLERAWDRPWVRLVVPFALVTGGLFWWDGARIQRPGFLEQSLISYGRLGPAQAGTLGERAMGWLRLTGYLWHWPGSTILLGVALAAWLGRQAKTSKARQWANRANLRNGTAIDLAMAGFVVLFLLLHWLVGFQVWDRYLLGLVPLLAILAARAVVGLGQTSVAAGRPWSTAYGGMLMLGLMGLIVPVAGGLTTSAMPMNADHRAYDGIDRLAATVRTEVPSGAVLYHHWLGYHYRFYLYGTPLRLHWYPDPADLVQDAIQYRREPRYIAFPSFRDSAPMRAALETAGIRLTAVYETTRRDGTVSFALYRMDGP